MTTQPNPPARRAGTGHALFSRTTTASVSVRDRFEYWRHLFFGSYIDLPDRERAADFHGDMLGCTGDGAAYSSLSADPLVCSFGQRDSGLMLLGTVHSGIWQVRHGHDGATVMDPGSGLLLFDCDRPAIARSTRYNLSYLILPRSAVVAALGRADPVPRGEAFLKLPPRGLTPVLLAHLQAMAEHGAGLTEAEGAAAMGAATGLAMTLLSGLRAPAERRDGQYDDALFAAARRYIALNCGRFDLTVDDIAAAVGCSRAHLYRVFATHGRTVAGDLREVRLRRARRLIETQPGRPIGMVAFDCGYTDLTAFGKAFRRHYGCSPSDWRATADAGAQSPETPDRTI